MSQSSFDQQHRNHSSPSQPSSKQSQSSFQQYFKPKQLVNLTIPARSGSQQQFFTSQQNMTQQQMLTKQYTQLEQESSSSVHRVFGPSTPQKSNVFQSQKSLRILGNMNSNQQDNSFRGSSQKKQASFIQQNYSSHQGQFQVSDSPQAHQVNYHKQTNSTQGVNQQHPSYLQSGQKMKQSTNNKENTMREQIQHIKTDNLESSQPSQPTFELKFKINKLVAENNKLNEFIQRQFKEKAEMKQKIEQLSKEPRESVGLHQMQDRVERLAQVVEDQAQEIEIWKLKYQEVCEQEQSKNYDDQRELIEQMEKQIMVVVEENERLNNLKSEMEVTINNQNNQGEHEITQTKIEELELMLQDLEDQLQCQRENEQLYQDEIILQRDEKLLVQNELEKILNQQVERKSQERKVGEEYINQNQNEQQSGHSSKILIQNLKQIEKQIEGISLFHAEKLQKQTDSAAYQLQEITNQNLLLKQQNKQLLEEKNNNFGTRRPSIVVSTQLQEIRETITQSIDQITKMMIK